MKPFISLLLASAFASSAAFAGGEGLEEYYCSSPSHHVSVTLVTKLGSDLYKKGFQLEVSRDGTESTYEITSYSNDGNFIQFTMRPIENEPDLGTFVFSDRDEPTPQTTIQVIQNGVSDTATDVSCPFI
jgi:hypothetical protein